jgi:geranylgeranyl diphosphate synthase type II
MDIDTFLADGRRYIDEKLEELTSAPADLPYAALFSSARYSLFTPGKRLRPLLTLATAASYGLSHEVALVPACAIEMVHTYSLIHDDLPCMDDDEMRRGKPTLHKVFPEWHALLTGDYLLTYAFELLAEAPSLGDKQKVALVRTLALRSGAHGMIGGQMIDLLSEGEQVSWDLLEKMHLGKTAGLIAASLEFGGIIAGASETDMKALQKTGLAIGIAFQLIDDLLDDTGTEEELGKPIGSDRENFKATAVSVLGSLATQEMATKLLKASDDNLSSLSCPAPLLRALLDQMVHRRK